MKMALGELVVAVIASGVLTAAVTHWFDRRKQKADITLVHVQTALDLEERAISRYHTALAALDAAQQALDTAREELRQQELYIIELHALLDSVGIKYRLPDEPAASADSSVALS